MLILIPIILLLLFAVCITLLGRYKTSPGSTWLLTAGAVLVVWISLILFRSHLQAGVILDNWSPFIVGDNQLVFNLSTRTWIPAFLLVSLLVGVIFADTIRFGQSKSLITWTGSMFLTAVGLFSIYSQTLLGIILTWTIIDFVEFVILLRITNHEKVHYAVFLEFTTRILGTGLIVAAFVLSGQESVISDFSTIDQNSYLLLILGATLRLGVLPLHVPLTANLPIRRSLGTVLRFVAPITVFSFLSQIPPQAQYSELLSFFLPVALIIALYGAIRWFNESNELSGRPFWMLSFSGLAIVCFLTGNIDSLIAICTIMITCGGFAFLQSRTSKFTSSLGILCLLSVSGFPFVPGESLWQFVNESNHFFLKILFVTTLSFLFFGFIKKLIRKQIEDVIPEIWMKIFYLSGLFMLIAVPWIIQIWQTRVFQRENTWIAPVICLGIAAILIGFDKTNLLKKTTKNPLFQKLLVPLGYTGRFVGTLFKFEWFFKLIQKLFDFFSRPLKFFVTLLEGDGGLLWSFIFLALISSVLIAEIIP